MRFFSGSRWQTDLVSLLISVAFMPLVIVGASELMHASGAVDSSYTVKCNTTNEPQVRFKITSLKVTNLQGRVSIPVELVNSGPFSVRAKIVLPSCETGQHNELTTLHWESGTDGIMLAELGEAKVLLQSETKRSVLLRLDADNAMVSLNGTVLVSLDDPETMPRFAVVTTTTYPGDDATLTIEFLGEELLEPALIRYCLRDYDSQYLSVKKYIAPSYLTGFVRFQPGDVVQSVKLPIQWRLVPSDAFVVLVALLEGFSNAWPLDQEKEVALYISGIAMGSCPPGATIPDANRSNGTVGKKEIPGTAPESELPMPEIFIREQYVMRVFSSSEEVPLAVLEKSITNSSDDYTVPDAMTDIAMEIGGIVPNYEYSATICLYKWNDSPVDVAQGFYDIVGVSGPSTAEWEDNVTCRNMSNNAVDSGAKPALAWSLYLEPGPNYFYLKPNASLNTVSDGVIGVNIVREAKQSHTQLRSISIADLNGNSVLACGPSNLDLGSNSSFSSILKELQTMNITRTGVAVEDYPDSSHGMQWSFCEPDVPIIVSLPATVDIVRVAAELMHTGIPGIRVEANGQVLSRGGNVEADREVDVKPVSGASTSSESEGFLPPVYLLGLEPNIEVSVDVVVIAEDGITSSKYPLKLRREMQQTEMPSSGGGGSIVVGKFPKTLCEDPFSLAIAPSDCVRCAPGWYSSSVNSTRCEMCLPGSSASRIGSSSCSLCLPGTYSISWGSTHCRHCIAGTYSLSYGSRSCRLCPPGTTTAQDGQSHCNVALDPPADLNFRYAVLVSFSVNLTGVDPDGVSLKTGVAAPPESIVGSLLRLDTAAAFNISMQDVEVLSVRHVAHRVLQANVTATIGVPIPEDATEEEIRVALAVHRLSADEYIQQLSQDPDMFFGRTTKALDVDVRPLDVSSVEWRPAKKPIISRILLIAPGCAGLFTGILFVIIALIQSHKTWKRLSYRRYRDLRQPQDSTLTTGSAADSLRLRS